MYLKKILLGCVFISFLLSCTSDKQITEIPSIIPIPNQFDIDKGYFVLNSETTIMYPKEFEITGTFVMDWLALKPFLKTIGKNQIIFVKDDAITGANMRCAALMAAFCGS